MLTTRHLAVAVMMARTLTVLAAAGLVAVGLAPATAAPASLAPAGSATVGPPPAGSAPAGSATVGPPPAGSAMAGSTSAGPRDLVVGFDPGAGPTVRARALGEGGVTRTGAIPQIGAYRVRLSGRADYRTATARLQSVAGVAWVEPVHAVRAQVSAESTPSDPGFGQQWGMSRGQFPQAWDVSTGTAQVIAMVDTGIDADHEDLVGNLWSNPGEVGGNGIDDDGNGRIDDVHGWSFLGVANGGNGNADTRDDYGHGTHVSGVAAAVTGNAVGVAGAAPGARLMVIKTLDAQGNGADFDVAQGMVYAADEGASVINLSLGGPEPSTVLDIASAYARGRGALVVAATGNENTSSASWPAASPGVLAVAAVDASDLRAGFSNYRGSASMYPDLVAAPGSRIYSTVPNQPFTLQAQTGSLDYGTLSGTSMATPMVAGIAALVRAREPGLTVDQLRQRIEGSADPVGGSRYYGAGRVNALAALGGASAYPTPTNQDPREPNDTVQAATSVGATSPPDAYLFPAGDKDVYAIDVTVAGRLAAGMVGATDLDPVLSVLGPDGATLATSDSGRTDQGEAVDFGVATPGRYYVVASDAWGGWATHPYGMSISVTRDAVAPTVSIVSPANGAYVGDRVDVAAAASDDIGLAGVEFYGDGGTTPSVVSAPSGSGGRYVFGWDLRAARNGSRHTMQAKSVDGAGNSSARAQVSVTVDLGAPVIYRLVATPLSLAAGRGGALGRTSIRYGFFDSVARRGKLRISVLDSRGHVRRDFGSRSVANGAGRMAFNGRGARGALLPVGRYRIKATATDVRGLRAKTRYAWVRIVSSAASVRSDRW